MIYWNRSIPVSNVWRKENHVRKRKRNSDHDQWEWRESRTAKRQDELYRGERIAVTLRWQGWLSTLAHAHSAEGAWTFERPHILSRDVEVRDAETNDLVAMLYVRWTGEGTLKCTDGCTVDWAPTNLWQSHWAFFDAKDRALISFVDTSGLLEIRSLVNFYPSSLSAADSTLLTALGRYLIVLQRRDTAAATAAATSATVV